MGKSNHGKSKIYNLSWFAGKFRECDGKPGMNASAFLICDSVDKRVQGTMRFNPKQEFKTKGVCALVFSDEFPYFTVGRSLNNSLVIPNRSISKVHALFRKNGKALEIKDCRSTNGTYVCGEELEQNVFYGLSGYEDIRFGKRNEPSFIWQLYDVERFREYLKLFGH